MTREEFKLAFQATSTAARPAIVKQFLGDHAAKKDVHFVYNLIAHDEEQGARHDRIALLSSFTFDQLKEPLAVELFTRGVTTEFQVAGYSQYSQELLNPQSQTYTFDPTVIILAIRVEDIFEEFQWSFRSLDPEAIAQEQKEILETIVSLVKAVRAHSTATLLISSFAPAAEVFDGLHDSQDAGGQQAWIQVLNSEILAVTKNHPGVYLFDLDQSASMTGQLIHTDPKMWYTASIPYNPDTLLALSRSYARTIASRHGRKKCLVLDLDNTLWGGIIGEDGLDGIALGKTYPGNVYRDIQRQIKKLADQGVILALNSKNNEADAKEVFEKHPDVVLKWDDFAATRINWNSKPQNFVELAYEINIGLDSMVFVDDNPFETQMVAESLPQVEVVQFSENPLENLRVLRSLELFDTLDLTDEDRQKSEQYKAQAKRSRMQQEMTSMEDFYRGLEMRVQLRPCDSFAVKRVAQMTQKTNQFNLTTRRYSETDIHQFCESESHHVYTVSVVDKYGDNGLAGVVICQEIDDSWRMDTFLMSCRIIGRTIETAFLSFLVAEARELGIKTLIGEYIPTAKNALVEQVFQDHGFSPAGEVWTFQTEKTIPFPEWITLDES